jgi:WD40 repeat protein
VITKSYDPVRFLTGHDVFISYAHRDGTTYASNLGIELRAAGLSCYLDQYLGKSDIKIPDRVVAQLKRASMLVVVVSDAAAKSIPVRSEVEIFRRIGRPICIVSFENSFHVSDLAQLLPGMAPAQERNAALEIGSPSKEIVRRIEAMAKFRRLSQRQKLATVTALSILSVLVVALMGLGTLVSQATKDLHDTVLHAAGVRVASEGSSMAEGGRPEGVLRGVYQVLAGYRIAPGPETYFELQRTYMNTLQLHKIYSAHDPITAISMSMHGQCIAYGTAKGEMALLDAQDLGSLVIPLSAHQGTRITSVAISPDCQEIVTASVNGEIRFWKRSGATAMEIRNRVSLDQEIRVVRFSRDGQALAVGDAAGILRLYQLSTGSSRSVLAVVDGSVLDIDFSPQDDILVSAGGDRMIRRWRRSDLTPIGKPMEACLSSDVGDRGVNKVSFTDVTNILSAGADYRIRLWDSDKETEVWRESLAGPNEVSPSENFIMASSADGRLAISAYARKLTLWDLQKKSKIDVPLIDHDGTITGVALFPDGTRAVSAGLDGTLRMWHISLVAPGRVLKRRTVATSPVVVSGSDDRLFFGTKGGVKSFRLDTGQELPWFPLESGESVWVCALALSPDEKFLAAGTDSADLILFDLHSGHRRQLPRKHRIEVKGLAFTRDSKHLLSLGGDSVVLRWDYLNNPESPMTLSSHGDILQTHTDRFFIAIAPSGSNRHAVTDGFGMSLWDDDRKEKLFGPINEAARTINSFAFSHDGSWIFAGGEEGFLGIWDALTGRPSPRPQPSKIRGIVRTVASHPKLPIVAIGGYFTNISFWDVLTGKQIGKDFGIELMNKERDVRSLAFAPDGQRLISEGGDLIIWPVLEGWASELCRKLTRNMTSDEWNEWVSGDAKYAVQCKDLQ